MSEAPFGFITRYPCLSEVRFGSSCTEAEAGFWPFCPATISGLIARVENLSLSKGSQLGCLERPPTLRPFGFCGNLCSCQTSGSLCDKKGNQGLKRFRVGAHYLPSFSLRSVHSKVVSPGQYRGKPQLIQLGSSNPHCALPEFGARTRNSLRRAYVAVWKKQISRRFQRITPN